MKTNRAGLDLIRHFEGYKPDWYRDSAGVLTIGVGHTGTLPPGFRAPLSEQEALRLLALDVEEAERAVDRLVTVPLNQNQHAALVAWTFNLGAGALASSTLLKRLNAGDYAGAADEMLRWDKARNPRTGRLEVLAGLTRRREAERALFLRPVELVIEVPPGTERVVLEITKP